MRYLGSIVIVMSLVVGTMYAQQANRQFHVYGISDTSCGSWLKRDLKRVTYEWWVAGFVSGASKGGMKLRPSDMDALAAWMDKYCQEHPLDPVVRGAAELVQELQVK